MCLAPPTPILELTLCGLLAQAAMCGALMMVFNDGSNIIEKYYEPDTEFIYWYNHTDLKQVPTGSLEGGGSCTGIGTGWQLL